LSSDEDDYAWLVSGIWFLRWEKEEILNEMERNDMKMQVLWAEWAAVVVMDRTRAFLSGNS